MPTLHLHRRYSSATLRIADVQCDGHDDDHVEEEAPPTHEIVLPISGVFLHESRSQRSVADPQHVLFFPRGEPFRILHPVAGGDRCTVLSLSDETLFHIRPGPHLDPGSAPLSSQTSLLHATLRAHLAGSGEPDPLAVDEAAVALGASALASRGEVARTPARRESTRREHADLVARAQLSLASRFRSRVTLDEVARDAHTSPYHLCRVFRAQTGTTVHRYLVRLRLSHSLEPLAEGSPDLSALAQDLGFSSHSHFTAAFRRELGIPPSRLHEVATAARLSEMSKALTA